GVEVARQASERQSRLREGRLARRWRGGAVLVQVPDAARWPRSALLRRTGIPHVRLPRRRRRRGGYARARHAADLRLLRRRRRWPAHAARSGLPPPAHREPYPLLTRHRMMISIPSLPL